MENPRATTIAICLKVDNSFFRISISVSCSFVHRRGSSIEHLTEAIISETSSNIFSGLDELKKYNHYNFDNLIEQLDLEQKMRIIESYIKYLEHKINIESINLSIESIISIIKKINLENFRKKNKVGVKKKRQKF